MSYPETLETYAALQPGDRVQIDHEVKVGSRQWPTTTIGTVVRKERRRHSLHFRRNLDDRRKVSVRKTVRGSGHNHRMGCPSEYHGKMPWR